MLTYLLDTNAIRSATCRRLAEKAQEHELLASPFAFWEIALHLGDPEDFGRIKANLMKFRHVELLQDSTSEAEREIPLSPIDIENTLETPDVVYAMLAALDASNSIDELYKCRIRDSNGAVRGIDGCVSRIQDILMTEERRFKEFITNVRELLRTRRVVLDTPRAFHDGILDLTNAWWIQVKLRSDQSDESYRKLIKRGYFFYAYVLYRAAYYADPGAKKYDENDFEDAKQLQHLKIDDKVTVVTSDKGLTACLQKAVQTLNGLNDDWYRTNVQVCDTRSFCSAE
jgi:hypothetical protein